MKIIYKTQVVILSMFLLLSCKEQTNHNDESNDIVLSDDTLISKDTLFGSFYSGMDKDSPSINYNDGYTFYNKSDSIHFDFSFEFDRKNKLDTLVLNHYNEDSNDKDFEYILRLYEDKYGKFTKKQITKKEIAFQYYKIKRIFWGNKNKYDYAVDNRKIHECDENPFICGSFKCYISCKDEYGFHIQTTNLKTGDLEFLNVEMEKKDAEFSNYNLTSYYKVVDSKYIELNQVNYMEKGRDKKRFDYTKLINFSNNVITIKYSSVINKVRTDSLFIDEQKMKNKSDI
ncbi:hypothetical protein [Flavobacterium beibuense]|uniref:Lipoprotein n=1 Tax=Flavobacterium beibuense TaxID=657326 RepID=A0A444WBR6_9FLAO|nr:hypothetical protein [Flavobacterium beibuense]RYJ43281.1 hypothetical protein NU09_1619 [Flavobacterium beibuense]